MNVFLPYHSLILSFKESFHCTDSSSGTRGISSVSAQRGHCGYLFLCIVSRTSSHWLPIPLSVCAGVKTESLSYQNRHKTIQFNTSYFLFPTRMEGLCACPQCATQLTFTLTLRFARLPTEQGLAAFQTLQHEQEQSGSQLHSKREFVLPEENISFTQSCFSWVPLKHCRTNVWICVKMCGSTAGREGDTSQTGTISNPVYPAEHEHEAGY